MLDILTKVKKARMGLVIHYPFFGSLALNLKLVEDPDCETFYTDGVHLGYNPVLVENIPNAQIQAEVAHECMHVGLGHIHRKGQRDHDLWNLAGDYAINPILKDCGFQLGNDWVLDDKYRGMTAETIYKLLKQEQQKGGGKNSDGKSKCGCGGLKPHPDMKGKAGSVASATAKHIETQVKINMAQALATAKACGKMPGSLQMFVEGILNPKISWIEYLRRFVELAAKNDYSWSTPNQRYIQSGFYLPTLRNQEIGEIILVIDSSCSVSKDELIEFATELTGMLETVDLGLVTVVYCDTKIAGVEEFTKDDLPLRLNVSGRGGTDFKPPFKWVEDNEKTPACLIYMTDLECSSYPQEPDYPVLWVSKKKNGKIPFGELIEFD